MRRDRWGIWRGMEWGIMLDSTRGTAMAGMPKERHLLLGGRWFDPPPESWPKRFKTRRQAREAAKAMTDHFAYLRPSHIWIFRAVRLRITVEEEKRR